jgi:HYR domain
VIKGGALAATALAAVILVPAASADPPQITVPAAMTVEAQSSAGAAVTYTATAVNDLGDPVPVSCEPSSGSTFPLGTTTVICTATDDGDTATERFTVTVADRTPPALSVPPNKSLRTRSARGVVVPFVAVAVDAIDGPVAWTCTPPPGSVFPRGTTVVTCSARDHSGNVATASFTITVAIVRAARRAAALFSPARGARVPGPPLLEWRRVPRATFYNVQLYRQGHKILTTWPRRSRLALRESWQHDGRRFRLRPGVYTWLVWPAFGTRAVPRYGRLLGQSSFRVI